MNDTQQVHAFLTGPTLPLEERLSQSEIVAGRVHHLIEHARVSRLVVAEALKGIPLPYHDSFRKVKVVPYLAGPWNEIGAATRPPHPGPTLAVLWIACEIPTSRVQEWFLDRSLHAFRGPYTSGVVVYQEPGPAVDHPLHHQLNNDPRLSMVGMRVHGGDLSLFASWANLDVIL